MNVKLLHHTPIEIVVKAIRTCWQSFDKSDNGGPKDMELIDRIANKHKHGSTIEHLVYTFEITLSRACLQEWARHRISSFSVKSSRYTLKELDDAKDSELMNFLVPIDAEVNNANVAQLRKVRDSKSSNDIRKYMLPEAYKTSMIWTVNARSLQNFLTLRRSPAALNEIRVLANEVLIALPEQHRFLFEEK